MLVGKKAPVFTAQAVVEGNKFEEKFSLKQYLGKKYVVLFFYPKDFTFVCPTELHAFQEKLAEFEKRGVQIVGASTDTEQSHWGWLQLPKKEGGIQGVTYPLVADTNKTISRAFDVLPDNDDEDYTYDEEKDEYEEIITNETELIAYRGLFLIDKAGVVRHQLINDLPLGRSVDEVLRIVDALKFVEENGEVCPANWNSEKEGMKASHEGTAEYLAKK